MYILDVSCMERDVSGLVLGQKRTWTLTGYMWARLTCVLARSVYKGVQVRVKTIHLDPDLGFRTVYRSNYRKLSIFMFYVNIILLGLYKSYYIITLTAFTMGVSVSLLLYII